MPTCPSCGSEGREGKRFCADCGTAIETPTSTPTETSLGSEPEGDSLLRGQSPGRFIPGTVLAKRYRVVSLLGRGGMGEVYRADDLKLGQPVALKFLPAGVQRDRARLDRFLNEVKTALKVTHPNVCRVHDIGEVEGQHYISMEYVDGEDLASLLRRIGRLPQDKAVQIARQLCAGLAAAHEEGILHRDLKPANVMIDGRGRAKITDFGLAGLAEGIREEDVRAGTPMYMAPEQLEGKEVTVRSDLYSLGLVLYELFTGKRAFDAATPAELLRLERESTPSSPSSHVEGLDPAVERVILRCLAREAGDRPASALAVAAGFPGGDPLAAALAAGETPSPEMVADAGGEGSLRPVVAASLLAGLLVGLVAVAFGVGRARIYRQIPLPKPPEELTVAARAVIEDAGYADPPVDRVFGFASDGDYFRKQEDDPSIDRWDDLGSVRPVPFRFWYRQSPRYMVPANWVGWLAPTDPPSIESGMIDVDLDPAGRLLRFQAVPPERDDSAPLTLEPDWGIFFERAGLDLAGFEETEPAWAPLVASDTRRAWLEAAAGTDEDRLRVEASAFRGRPVYFEVIPDWRVPRRMEPPPVPTGDKIRGAIAIMLVGGVLVGGLLLARRNIRLGRGDRRGATRLAAFLFAVRSLVWILRIDHVPTSDELEILSDVFRQALFEAMIAWLYYVALEPYVRRLWPHALIGWTRMLAGRLKDPLIGRQLLYGTLIGIAFSGLDRLSIESARWLGRPPLAPFTGPLSWLEGWRQVAAGFLVVWLQALTLPVVFLLLIVLLRILLRRLWATALAFVFLGALLGAFNQALGPALGATVAFVGFSLGFVVLVRFGLLTLMAAIAFSTWGGVLVTADPSTWYFGRSLATMLAFAAIACWAFYISLGGQPVFRDRVLDG